MRRPRIALFVRYPTPGVAKTRLIPALGAAAAAALHRRLVARTLAAVRTSGPQFEVRSTGADAADFAAWLKIRLYDRLKYAKRIDTVFLCCSAISTALRKGWSMHGRSATSSKDRYDT